MTTPVPESKTTRAIIHIIVKGKNTLRVNYARRMYAIIRRYTPEAAEGVANECFAELTGLRSFFKMTYAEIATKIMNDLYKEIGIRCTLRIATTDQFENAIRTSKKSRNISTYKEINNHFAGKLFNDRLLLTQVDKTKIQALKKIRLTVPYIGKVL